MKNKNGEACCKLALVGASGRTGGEVLRLAREDDKLKSKFQIAAGICRKKIEGIRCISSLAEASPNEVDVVVDFSSPQFWSQVLGWCVSHKKPFVSGTTGLSEEQKSHLVSASKDIAILWAPNMSMGIAFLNKVTQEFNRLSGFDFQIEDIHHRHKKDAPSGTAILLQNTLQKQTPKPLPAIASFRGGGVFGVHRVYAFGEEETLTFEHTALNRAVFARGALQGALWLARQKAGLYTMDDLLMGGIDFKGSSD